MYALPANWHASEMKRSRDLPSDTRKDILLISSNTTTINISSTPLFLLVTSGLTELFKGFPLFNCHTKNNLSPNCFALLCVGPFHKINGGYATLGYFMDKRPLQKHSKLSKKP